MKNRFEYTRIIVFVAVVSISILFISPLSFAWDGPDGLARLSLLLKNADVIKHGRRFYRMAIASKTLGNKDESSYLKDDATRLFFMAVKNLNSSTCKINVDRKVSRWGDRKVVTLIQRWNGVPVVGAVSRMVFNRNSSFMGGVGRIAGCMAQVGEAVINESKAVQIAYKAMNIVDLDEVKYTSASEMVIEDPRGNGFIPCYKVSVKLRSEQKFEDLFISRVDGSIVARRNRIMLASKGTPSLEGAPYNINGRGNVFLQNPIEDAFPTEVALKALKGDGHLINLFFKVLSGPESDPYEIIYREDNDFTVPWAGFDTTDLHFAEVQAYYGTWRILDFYLKLGFEPRKIDGRYYKIPIVVHYRLDEEGMANAFYDGTEIVIGDGDGENYLPLSLDNDVVAHEFGHYVVDTINPFNVISGVGFSDALHEGYADYFAVASRGTAADIENDSQVAEGVRADGVPLRDIGSILPYYNIFTYNGSKEELLDDVNSDPHYLGMVWSTALWQLRKILIADYGSIDRGGRYTDRLAYGSLIYFEPTGPWGTAYVVDAYRALLEANRHIFSGDEMEHNEVVIRDVFEGMSGFPQISLAH